MKPNRNVFHLAILLVFTIARPLMANGEQTTITIAEIRYWMSDDPVVKSKLSEAKKILSQHLPHAQRNDNHTRLFAAAKGLSLTTRPLAGDILYQYALTLPPPAEGGDSEDAGISYVLGLAFVSERCGNFTRPNKNAETTFFSQVLPFYGSVPAEEARDFNSKILPMFANNKISIRVFISLFHYLPLSCERYIEFAYDFLHENLDGAPAGLAHEYPVDNYVANDIVYRLICKKPHRGGIL